MGMLFAKKFIMHEKVYDIYLWTETYSGLLIEVGLKSRPSDMDESGMGFMSSRDVFEKKKFHEKWWLMIERIYHSCTPTRSSLRFNISKLFPTYS